MVFLQEQIKDIIIIIISEESESFRFSEPASESLAIPGPPQASPRPLQV
jgi:hypothetical protein